MANIIAIYGMEFLQEQNMGTIETAFYNSNDFSDHDSAKTSMHPQDIALTMMLLSFVRKNHNNKFILAIDWPRVDQHMQRVAASLANKTR